MPCELSEEALEFRCSLFPFLSFFLSFLSPPSDNTLNSFSLSEALSSAHRCAFLAALEGSRTVPRTVCPAASRRATIDDATYPAAPVTQTVVFFVVFSRSESGLRRVHAMVIR